MEPLEADARRTKHEAEAAAQAASQARLLSVEDVRRGPEAKAALERLAVADVEAEYATKALENARKTADRAERLAAEAEAAIEQ